MSQPRQSEPVDPYALLTHFGWVRELSRSLVRDAHLAEDLAQDAWVASLEGAGATAAAPRRWWAGVLRNLSRQAARGQGRRRSRERSVARDECMPSTLELVERAALQRDVAGEVLQLEEPYRTTLLLRFLEERSLREIATRTGVPVSTVATRLARGLERLRERLRVEYCGGSRSWLAALAPIARARRNLPTVLSTGAAIVSTQVKIVLAALVVTGALLALRGFMSATDVVAESSGLPTDTTPALVTIGEPVEPSIESGARTVVTAVEPATSGAAVPEAQPAAAPIELRGLVVDPANLPVPGVLVCLRSAVDREGTPVAGEHDSEPCARSRVDGSFRITSQVYGGTLVVRDPRYVTVLSSRVSRALGSQPGTEAERVVVVAPRIDLAGWVLDAEGQAVPDADLLLQITSVVVRNLQRIPDTFTALHRPARTNDEGWFELPDASRVDGGMLLVRAPGFLQRMMQLPEASNRAMTIVLERASDTAQTVAGQVVDPSGLPVEGAYVSGGQLTTTTDASGFFSLQHTFGPPIRILRALKEDYLPAVFEPEVSGETVSWPEFVTLELGGAPLSIAGRVVDEAGEAAPGVVVLLIEKTPFGLMRADWDPSMFTTRDAEDLLGSGGRRRPAVTDAEGRFRLDGLLDRDYRIEAYDKDTLQHATTAPVAAGTRNVVVTLPAADVHPRVAGMVVDHAGNGLAGILVSASLHTARAMIFVGDTTTDDGGRFELADVAKSSVVLRVEGDAIVPLYDHALPEAGDVETLEIRVDRRCHVQIDQTDSSVVANQMRVLDGAGEALQVWQYRGNVNTVSDAAFLPRGLSDVFVIGESAKTLVLERDGEELQRIGVDLVPGEVNVIRP